MRKILLMIVMILGCIVAKGQIFDIDSVKYICKNLDSIKYDKIEIYDFEDSINNDDKVIHCKGKFLKSKIDFSNYESSNYWVNETIDSIIVNILDTAEIKCVMFDKFNKNGFDRFYIFEYYIKNNTKYFVYKKISFSIGKFWCNDGTYIETSGKSFNIDFYNTSEKDFINERNDIYDGRVYFPMKNSGIYILNNKIVEMD